VIDTENRVFQHNLRIPAIPSLGTYRFAISAAGSPTQILIGGPTFHETEAQLLRWAFAT
jgi:hypothetical protein